MIPPTRQSIARVARRFAVPTLLAASGVISGAPWRGAEAHSAPVAGDFTAVYLIAQDTFAVERVVATDSAWVGDLRLRGQPRMRWTQPLREAPGVRTLQLAVWQPGAAESSAPMQHLVLRVRGDSAYVYNAPAAGTALGAPQATLPAHAGASWLLNQSVVHTGLLLQTGTSPGAASRDTVWMVFSSGARLVPATVARGADTTTIRIAGQAIQYVFTEDGALQFAAIPSQQLTVHILRGAAARALVSPDAAPRSYDAPPDAPYAAEDVTVPTPMGHTLAGTLTRPRDAGARVPAVITITGSGAQERDEAIAGVDGYALFRQVADTLGRRGIAVLRLDDRGVGASGGTFATAASRDFAEDIRAAVAFLRARDDIDPSRIALVGHSEGGLIAPMVAADDSTIAGIALLAGPAYTGQRIIAFQQRQAIAEASPGSFASARDSMFREAQAQLDTLSRASPWLREFRAYDPVPTAKRVRIPVLILQGERDLQVTAEQADTLLAAFRAGGNTRVTMHRLRNTNHLFQRDPSGLPSGYGTLKDRRVTNESLGLLADWLTETLGASQLH